MDHLKNVAFNLNLPIKKYLNNSCPQCNLSLCKLVELRNDDSVNSKMFACNNQHDKAKLT